MSIDFQPNPHATPIGKDKGFIRSRQCQFQMVLGHLDKNMDQKISSTPKLFTTHISINLSWTRNPNTTENPKRLENMRLSEA